MSLTTAQSRGLVRSVGRSGGYTLIEVMVVAVIVVLMLGMALPVFRAITGSRSEAGASNLIASMLGRARTDAIGLDRNIGVAFLYNPSSQLSYMAEVEFADAPAWVPGQTVNPLGYVSITNGYTYYYINNNSGSVTLPTAPTSPSQTQEAVNGGYYVQPVGGPPVEIVAGTELLPLPTGIGVATVANCNVVAGARTSNGYLNFGVILFDGSGRMTSSNYGASQYSRLMTSTQINKDLPMVGLTVYANNAFGVSSQYGVVVFQREAFQSQYPVSATEVLYSDATPSSNTTTYPNYTNGTPSQQTGDNWLDQNATPLLIDRYTGTLIKAE